jgi:hypothetical protein
VGEAAKGAGGWARGGSTRRRRARYYAFKDAPRSLSPRPPRPPRPPCPPCPPCPRQPPPKPKSAERLTCKLGRRVRLALGNPHGKLHDEELFREGEGGGKTGDGGRGGIRVTVLGVARYGRSYGSV